MTADSYQPGVATARFVLKSGQKRTVAIPFSEFSLDDPAWKVLEGDTFMDVDRRFLDLVGLMIRAQAGTQTIYVHEIGFYDHRRSRHGGELSRRKCTRGSHCDKCHHSATITRVL